jgi:DNA-binding CsgD family transcriptional regulator
MAASDSPFQDNTTRHADEPSNPKSQEAAKAFDRTILNSLSAHIAIIDQKGVILETNTAWRKYAWQSGMPESYDGVGTHYLEACESASGSEAQDGGAVARGIRGVIKGEIQEFLYDYPCHAPDGPHWYYMRAIRQSGPGPIRVVVSHEEITELKLAEEALEESRKTLLEQKQSLEETNIALKVLLKKRDEDKVELERKFITNVKGLVIPYVEKLKNAPLKPKDKTLVEIIESHLNDLLSPMLQSFANAKIVLTPQEMQVAGLVKDGKTSKEIAQILNVAETTVNFHRKNLRKKFGLNRQQSNLRSYLLSIS